MKINSISQISEERRAKYYMMLLMCGKEGEKRCVKCEGDVAMDT